MNSKALASLLVLFTISAASTQAQKKIKINEPIPKEYTDKIYLNNKIDFVTPGVIILANTHAPSFVLNALAKKQQRIKEEKIAKEKVFENDSVLVIKAIKKEIFSVLKEKGIQSGKKNDQTKHILNLKVYDHGFHWASSSAAGIFLRVQAEITSLDGEKLWSMVYTMTKDEAKTTHKRGGMTLNKCIDKCIADFEKKPELLSETYQLIAGYLAEKIITNK